MQYIDHKYLYILFMHMKLSPYVCWDFEHSGSIIHSC